MKRSRISESDAAFLEAASLWARFGTCDRAAVGCVLVVGGSIVAYGYNDSLAGTPSCVTAGHLMVGGHCWRTIHAEQAAVALAAREGVGVAGAVAYVTHLPCSSCTKLLAAAGIVRVVYREEYRDATNRYLLAASGMEVVRLK